MHLTEEDIDALGEVVNIGVGRAAGSLSDLIGTRINLRVPKISIVDASDDRLQNKSEMSVVQEFEGVVTGNALLVFPTESGRKLAGLLGGFDDGEDIAEFELSGILSEVGNIVLNGVLGSLANAITADLTYQVPEFSNDNSIRSLISSDDLVGSPQMPSILMADAKFNVEESDISGSVVLVFKLGSLQNLLERLEALYS